MRHAIGDTDQYADKYPDVNGHFDTNEYANSDGDCNGNSDRHAADVDPIQLRNLHGG